MPAALGEGLLRLRRTRVRFPPPPRVVTRQCEDCWRWTITLVAFDDLVSPGEGVADANTGWLGGSPTARGSRDDCRLERRSDDEPFRQPVGTFQADPPPRECARKHKDHSWHEDGQERGPSCIPLCASCDHPSSGRSTQRQRSDSRYTSPISAALDVRRRKHFSIDTKGCGGPGVTSPKSRPSG
jgi:hypothetical protein